MNFIYLDSIEKVYVNNDRKTYAIRDISLKVNKEDFIIIMGPSGSGKTTLLNIIGLLTDLSKGTYLLEGKDVARISPKQKAFYRNSKFGYLVQDFALIEEYSIYNNIVLPLKYSTKKNSKKDLENKVNALIEEYGIEAKPEDKVKNLSVGQRQRVALCRALINDPEIILADEPTGSLDSVNSKVVIDNLNKLNKMGRTIIMVTHNEELIKYATKTFFIRDGKIIED